MADDWFSQFIYRKVPMHVQNDSVNHALDMLFGDANKNRWRYDVAKMPFIGTYYRGVDQRNYWNDYMANRGLSWADAKYPTMMPGAGSVGASAMGDIMGSAFMGRSKTLDRLYQGLKQDFGDWEPVRPYTLPPGGKSFRMGRTTRYFYR